jgi:hypothetical protein
VARFSHVGALWRRRDAFGTDHACVPAAVPSFAAELSPPGFEPWRNVGQRVLCDWSRSSCSDGGSQQGVALAAEPTAQAVTRCLLRRGIGAGAFSRESRAAL